MDMISLQGKTNFFEKRVSDYAKAGVKHTQAAADAEPTNDKLLCVLSLIPCQSVLTDLL